MVLAEACLVDGERAMQQRFRLVGPVGGSQQLGEIAEVTPVLWRKCKNLFSLGRKPVGAHS
jgi:hypothetical protein